MRTTKLFAVFLLALVVGILVLHILSIIYDWYHAYWWIDIILHLLGGAWVATLFFYVQERYVPSFVAMPWWFSIVVVVSFVMLVGVGWEWFEYWFDYFVAKDNFVLRAQLGLADTMGDLLADLVGGLIVGAYFIFRR